MPRLPTEAELGILGVLWERGPLSVRQVLHALQEAREVGYTTVLKLMQIMTDKGLLVCDKSVRPQIYRAAKSRNATQKQLVRNLLDRAFAGSPGNLILQALSTKRSTAEERRRIREFLDRLEEDSQ
jgi:predicted transcriptional regulator